MKVERERERVSAGESVQKRLFHVFLKINVRKFICELEKAKHYIEASPFK
jgi:hypothetical protein